MGNYNNLLNDICLEKGTQLEIAIKNGYTQGYVSYVKKLISNMEFKPKIIDDEVCCYFCDKNKNLEIYYDDEKPIGIICKKCNLKMKNKCSFEEKCEKKEYPKGWLSKEEITKLFNNPNIPARDLLLMRVCYYGAFRISEVLNGKREDYIEENKEYYLLLRKQKTDKKNWEKQPIPDFIYGEIKRYCEAYDVWEQSYVFSSRRNEKLSYFEANVLVKKWVKDTGIDKEVSTHVFRRSMATYLLDHGFELQDVSKFLRHKRLETTMTYLKISKSSLYKKMNKIVNQIR